MVPNIPLIAGTCIPGGRTKSYLCNNDVMNKNSSIFASDSPRHARLPAIKETCYRFFRVKFHWLIWVWVDMFVFCFWDTLTVFGTH